MLAWCDSFYGGNMLGVGFECFGRVMHHGGKDAGRYYSATMPNNNDLAASEYPQDW